MDDSNYLVRPRLNDYYGIFLNQAKVDFAIPYLNEDIPLYVDPFRLWQSPSYQDNGLHILFQNAFNCLGKMYLEGQQEKAVELLKRISECNEVGLGNSNSRNGRKIGDGIAIDILRLYETIPSINKYGLKHPEVIQMLVNDISKDRISDIASNMLGSFLIDYTIQECRQYGIPTEKCEIEYLDVKNMDMKKLLCLHLIL